MGENGKAFPKFGISPHKTEANRLNDRDYK